MEIQGALERGHKLEAIATEHKKEQDNLYQIKTLLDRWNERIVMLMAEDPLPSSPQGVELLTMSVMVDALEKIIFASLYENNQDQTAPDFDQPEEP